jgi:hypothetical protein
VRSEAPEDGLPALSEAENATPEWRCPVRRPRATSASCAQFRPKLSSWRHPRTHLVPASRAVATSGRTTGPAREPNPPKSAPRVAGAKAPPWIRAIQGCSLREVDCRRRLEASFPRGLLGVRRGDSRRRAPDQGGVWRRSSATRTREAQRVNESRSRSAFSPDSERGLVPHEGGCRTGGRRLGPRTASS